MATTRVKDIVHIAAGLSLIPAREILGKSRMRHIVRVRQAVAYVCLRQGVHSSAQIGRVLGRDHSTVLHSYEQAEAIMERNSEYAAFINAIMAEADGCDPWVADRAFEFVVPTKPRQKHRIVSADMDDEGYRFHRGVKNGSDKLLKAMAAA